MARRLFCTLGGLVLAGLIPGVGCTLAVDPAVAYCDRVGASNGFEDPSFEALTAACWNVGNTDAEHAELFLDSGDLVARANPTVTGAASWVGAEQGAFVYQTFDDDFAMVARVETVNAVSGDHCLESGNAAGIVVRTKVGGAVGGSFATLFIAPFTPDPVPPGADCHEGATTYPPTRVTMASSFDAWGVPSSSDGVNQQGVGVDGEADIAVCRINDTLAFFVRDPASSTAVPKWDLLGQYMVGDGAFDVGLTAAGAPPTFAAEGHFTWVAYSDGLPADGCQGALDAVTLPALD